MRVRKEESFAEVWPEMYNKKSRERRAIRIIKLLEDYFGKKNLKKLSLLDIGASTGIIDNKLAEFFHKVTGIDVDKDAIKFAGKKFKRANLSFRVGDAMKLSFKENSFDVVICTQIYEHVPNPQKMFNEIYRVLKPGGVCYLAALNSLWIIEPHHKLPFLSWLPKNLGNLYIRALGKADYYEENLKTYWGLRKITKKFKVYDYTPRILRNPKKFGYDKVSEFPLSVIAWFFSWTTTITAPTFFWILVKKS